MRSSLGLDVGFGKLQTCLLEMAPGDEMSVERAMQISGLGHEVCTHVLESLTHAGLLMRLQHGAYIRYSGYLGPQPS